jgi:hypothetical protein
MTGRGGQNLSVIQSWNVHHLLGGGTYMLGTVLIVILILALLGVLPKWPHSKAWGYGPSGGLGVVLLIVLILLLLGWI